LAEGWLIFGKFAELAILGFPTFIFANFPATNPLCDSFKCRLNSLLKEQAKENILAAQNNLAGAAFQNSEKLLIPVNTTQALADELKTSTDTASRIIQIWEISLCKFAF
jgi:hypothetical protein